MIEVQTDQQSFRSLTRALAEESNGRELRADLAENLHEALRPAVAALQGAVMGMPTSGLGHAGEPLRSTVAAAVESDVRMSGRSAGARIRVKKGRMPRGFANAPKRLNSRRGWRHPVFGQDLWTQQVGEPGWFDDTLARGRTHYHRAVKRALDNSAQRIARRSYSLAS